MKALLVDLDDTLLDYTGGVDGCWLGACSALADPRRMPPEALVAAIARARRWFWADPDRHRRERTDMLGAWSKITAHALSELGCPDEALAAAIAQDFAERRWKRMALFAGVPEALEGLRQRGLRLALVTNGDHRHQRRKIEQHDLGRFFDVILIEGEFGAGKPDAVVFRHALDALGARPAEACMVGDHLINDVEGAGQLGIRTVWIDRARAGLPSGSAARPDHIIASLTELHRLG